MFRRRNLEWWSSKTTRISSSQILSLLRWRGLSSLAQWVKTAAMHIESISYCHTVPWGIGMSGFSEHMSVWEWIGKRFTGRTAWKGKGIESRSSWERPQTKVQVSTLGQAKRGQPGKHFWHQHCSEKVSATAKGTLWSKSLVKGPVTGKHSLALAS